MFPRLENEVVMQEPPHVNLTRGSATTATVYGMPAHVDRAAAIGEVHARPHPLIEAPSCLLQIAFMTEGDLSKDRAVMSALSQRLGVAEPDHATPLHGLSWDEGALHCEKHTEFSTYRWSAALDPETGAPCGANPFKHGFTPPGPVLSGIYLRILPWTAETEKEAERFDPISLCYSRVEDGSAAILTDFRQDEEGLTHILILARDLTPAQTGALAQRLLEIETYRILALLALPLKRSMTSDLRHMEARLAAITDEMCAGLVDRRKSEVLLSELTSLAAALEADVAGTLYRFGASKAYYEIVMARLAVLAEDTIPGYCTWHDFLYRRIAPAMRTCQSVKERQDKLSDKLTRAISLLHSWIDVELERQNRDLLTSMNNRARLQLRLQQTVEGLSVAAISYYVMGLLAYFLKGIPRLHKMVTPERATAILVPVVVLMIWWVIHKIRKAHGDALLDDKPS